MSKTTWGKIEAGATVELKGHPYEVEKAKRKGKLVKVRVTGPAGTFSREMRAKDTVRLAPRGERWATSGELKKAMATPKATRHAETRHEPPTMPKVEKSKVGWKEPEDAAEKVVRKYLDAELVAVEVDGVYLMPYVSPDTIAAHLMAFHGVTAEGVDMKEAKKLAGTHTATEAQALLGWEKLKAIHDREHEKIEAGKASALVAHIHTKDRPKGVKK